VPPVEHSVSWHDTIRIKGSVCHAVGVLQLCFTSGMPLLFSSTLTLSTSLFFFLLFSKLSKDDAKELGFVLAFGLVLGLALGLALGLVLGLVLGLALGLLRFCQTCVSVSR